MVDTPSDDGAERRGGPTQAATARAVVADARLVRRVVKRYRGITGMGLQVPHGHVIVLPRAALEGLVRLEDLGVAELPESVILVARPDLPELDRAPAVWRAAFHGHVHAELESRVRSGALGSAELKAKIDQIGQTEFDEIRAVLEGEHLLFSPGDDAEAYIEFAAFFLELRHFAAQDLAKYFPTLEDTARVEAALALELDAAALLARSRPAGAPPAPRDERDGEPRRQSGRVLAGDARAAAQAGARVGVLRALAERVRSDGNHARAAILQLQLDTPEARAGATADLSTLAARLVAALRPEHDDPAEQAGPAGPIAAEWERTLAPLAERAAGAWSPRSLEARVLFDLQKACVEHERERRAVDVITWVTSGFRRRIVRPLPMATRVRIARRLHHAFVTSHRAEIGAGDRRDLETTFRSAVSRARTNVERSVLPVLTAVLDEVGLRPSNVPEEVAREKLCAEILDQILERGFLGLSELRDALSRSNLKMGNLTLAALTGGDALLRADRQLSLRLDGVYRPGEVYLRGLQKASGVAFGTSLGRKITLHAVIPLLAAFVFLEALQHLAHGIGKKVGHPHVPIRTTLSMAVVALIVYGLLHSLPFRRAALGALSSAGSAVRTVFVGIPSWVLSRPVVKAFLRSAPFALFSRLVLKPLVLGAPGFLFARRHGLAAPGSAAAAGGVFVVAALFFGTPFGARMEESASDLVLRGIGNLRRHVIPGLVALALDVSRRAVERVERGIYTVDEWLTFRDGQGTLAVVMKGAFGLVWFFVTYLVRVYVNLLIEPQVNPIKHFPVVTVSHKILLPMAPTLLEAMRTPLVPLGAVVANTVAGTTVFLLPGVFGFLVWELKENWKLYAHNRAESLEPVRIGHHGETMNGLLVVGFHSGTVPKLFAKLRLAARRGARSVNAHREGVREVERGLTTFVERELAGLLRRVRRWTSGEVLVHAVRVGSNRIRVGLELRASPHEQGEREASDVAWLHFEEQSGWLVASVGEPGFFAVLSPEQRAIMETVLSGLYKLAAVDLVREQIEALIGEGARYDIADEGLIVWPEEGFRTELVYDLRGTGSLAPVVRGGRAEGEHPSVTAEELVFARQPIRWEAWVRAIEGDSERVLQGPSVLSARPRA
ncbi:MAG: hypothetical protein IPQ09_08875 [Myxococcales bacterium]|nr:hypothetical protein [Myxococcales bacterium]HQY61629.1 hypothetical protein [Polyangiaceae bacterium]